MKNEILVVDDNFDIRNLISNILKDKNYRKYAIQRPNKLKTIYTIDNWARKQVINLLGT